MTLFLAARLSQSDEADLRWRLGGEAEGALGLRSNFRDGPGHGGQLGLPGDHVSEAMVAAAERARRIDKRLAQLSPRHVHVLQRYVISAGSDVPPEVRGAFGRLAGVVALIRDDLPQLVTSHVRGRPDDRERLAAVRRQAETLLAEATRAYRCSTDTRRPPPPRP